jgi:hypothetical protein
MVSEASKSKENLNLGIQKSEIISHHRLNCLLKKPGLELRILIRFGKPSFSSGRKKNIEKFLVPCTLGRKVEVPYNHQRFGKDIAHIPFLS